MTATKKDEAQVYAAKAQLAIERALPRGTQYVVILAGPGFNTYGSNLGKAEAVDFMRGAIQALDRDRMQGG